MDEAAVPAGPEGEASLPRVFKTCGRGPRAVRPGCWRRLASRASPGVQSMQVKAFSTFEESE
eukprot:15431388-Alexandrium_andersonii.AAC.1